MYTCPAVSNAVKTGPRGVGGFFPKLLINISTKLSCLFKVLAFGHQRFHKAVVEPKRTILGFGRYSKKFTLGKKFISPSSQPVGKIVAIFLKQRFLVVKLRKLTE